MKLKICLILAMIMYLNMILCHTSESIVDTNVDKTPTDFIGSIGNEHIVHKEPFELTDCNQVLIMNTNIIMDQNDFSNQSKSTFVTLSAYIINFYLNSDKDDLYKSFYYKEVVNKPVSINYKSCIALGTLEETIRFCFTDNNKKDAFIKAFNFLYTCEQKKINSDPYNVTQYQKTYPEAKCEMEEILKIEAPKNVLYGKDVNVNNFAKKYSIPYNLDVTLLSYGVYRDTITGFSLTFLDRAELVNSLKGIFYTIMFDPKNRMVESSLSQVNDSLTNITGMSELQKYQILETAISERIKQFKKLPNTNIKGFPVYGFVMEEYELDRFQNKSLMQFYEELIKHVDESHLLQPNPMPLLDNPEYVKIANEVYSGKISQKKSSNGFLSGLPSLFNR